MPEFFFWNPNADVPILIGEYQVGLVILSIVIAIVICCVAMQIVGISQASETPQLRRLAIATGSVSMGIGIWCMHFIGMLAFHINTPVEYSTSITLLSVIPAIIASWFAIAILARKTITSQQLLLSALFVGAGIGTMHYSGMAAMQMEPLLRYDPMWFLASLIVSVTMAWIALYIRVGLKASKRFSTFSKTVFSGTVMGLSIASMHYVAMRAACFIGEDQQDVPFEADIWLIVAISCATLILGGMVLGGNLYLLFRNLYRQLHRSEAIQKGIVETSIDGILTFDQDGTILSVNPAVSRLFGWRTRELLGANVNMLMPEQQRALGSMKLLDYLHNRSEKLLGKERETSALRKDGSVFPIRLAIGEVCIDDVVTFVGFITDITDQKRIERILEREATHDSLTDLPNRRLLTLAMPRIIARAERTSELIAILFIDLDGFKDVNDSLGHDIGDELLKTVASRLLKIVRTTDIVARLGGDEFVVMLESISSKTDAEKMANRLLDELRTPMSLCGKTVSISASIGMSFYDKGCRLLAEELLQMADQAMYHAKKNGKNNIVIFDKSFNQ